jgi:bifunctional UDP-N-acetylglucosamine pyrophosphorylase/glucosamine-1-phosphate N-acetyltransferase
VPHLSYVGDAEVGEGTNLGASTITANYDGVNKHRTKIGRGVHTGVHTSLRAPVELGDGAETGAGSVVTNDVEPDTLVKGVPARPARPAGPPARDTGRG